MKMMGRVAVKIIGCALLLLAVAAYQPALADCPGVSVFFGNLGGLTVVRVDVADPSATWATYMLQDPTINQGPVPLGAVATDLGEFGGEPGTAFVFQDWGAGLGMIGCPMSLDVPPTGTIDDNAANEVFIFSDSKSRHRACGRLPGHCGGRARRIPGPNGGRPVLTPQDRAARKRETPELGNPSPGRISADTFSGGSGVLLHALALTRTGALRDPISFAPIRLSDGFPYRRRQRRGTNGSAIAREARDAMLTRKAPVGTTAGPCTKTNTGRSASEGVRPQEDYLLHRRPV
jgi:hypothetical protein